MQAMCLLEVERGKANGITFVDTEKKIFCGTTPTNFTEDLGSDWQLTIEMNCCTPFVDQPMLSLVFWGEELEVTLCNVILDFSQSCVRVIAGEKTREFSFIPRESGTVVFIQKDSQLYVNTEGCVCLLPYKCDSRISLAANGEFELRQITIERIR